MIWLLVLFVGGCAPKVNHVYSSCLVKEVKQDDFGDLHTWFTFCSDGSIVVLPRMIPSGEQVMYSAYYVNDSTATYGFIRSVHGHF